MGAKLKDIARLAGVSPTSVSLALNMKSGVSEETRARVIKAASEVGYRPRKSPQRSRTDSICFLHIARHGHAVNRDHDVFIADYISGLSEAATKGGFSLEVLTFNSVPVDEIIKTAVDHHSAGIVVLGTELSEEDVQAFSVVQTPLVFLDTYFNLLPYDFVDMNNEDAVCTIVAHFAARGHREIGIVRGAIETRNLRLRDEGFRVGLSRIGLSFNRRLSFSVDCTYHGAYNDMSALLRSGITLPSALFCANDIVACGCLKAFDEAGIKVPGDVSIIGFDDLPLASVSSPPLSTIRISKSHMGRLAVQLLTSRMNVKVQTPPVKVLVGGSLIERQSVRDF